MIFTPFKHQHEIGKEKLLGDSKRKAGNSHRPSEKALGKRRSGSKDYTGSSTDASSRTWCHEVGIPPNSALAAFDDLPPFCGPDGSLRRLYAYRRVWDHWNEAFEAGHMLFFVVPEPIGLQYPTGKGYRTSVSCNQTCLLPSQKHLSSHRVFSLA